MIFRTGKPSRGILVGLALFSILIFVLAESTARPEKQRNFERKLEAARLDQAAQTAIKDYSAEKGIAIDIQNDPFKTGLIGPEITPITTDRGVVSSKILSTNPNFAAAFVELLLKAKVKKHDVVAVGMTGSFPGWNIAFLSACKVLDLKPLIISSVGSSDWGANVPDLTWLDMERILNKKGLWNFKSIAASIGGGSDNGRGLSPEGRDLIRKAIRRNGVSLIEEGSLEANINKRMEIIDKQSRGGRIACYVNIGGGLASLGATQNARLIPPGVSMHLATMNFPVRGVIVRMAERGIPVIHLLNVEKMADRYGLPSTVGDRPPQLAQGVLFFRDKYSVTSTVTLTIILGIVLFVFIRIDVRRHLLKGGASVHHPRPAGGDDDLL